MLGVTLLNSALLAVVTDNGELAGLDELLGVVPSATGVGGGEGNLDTGDNAASEDTVGGLVAEESTSEKRGKDDKDAWGDHLLEGSVGGDGNAKLVVGLGVLTAGLGLGHNLELSLDFSEHLLSGITDGLHGHSGEPVGEHSANEETSEGEGLEDVDVVGSFSLGGGEKSLGHDSDGVGNTGHEGTEEGKSDEAGGSDGETLADGGSGVSSGIEVVSVLTDALIKVGHLGDTTSVIGDGAVAVNGEGNREAAEHADGGKSDTVHGGEFEGDEDGDGEAEDGDDGGEVSEGKTVDDVGGGTVLAGDGEVTGGGVVLGGVVLSDQSNDETGPETKDNAGVALPSGGGVVHAGEVDITTVLGEEVDGGDDHDSHKDGGDEELDLELGLDVVVLDVGKELAGERSDDANSGHNEGEVDGLRGSNHSSGSGRYDESGAGGLSEGSEKIGAHTGDVTNVVTDVVSDSAWVLGGVLGEGSINLTGEISADISSLGVDTATDSAEESDSGATETVSGDELEEVLNLDLAIGLEGSLVGEEEDLEDEEGKTNKDESEDLATLEGDLEAKELVDVAEVGGLDIADSGDHHADVAAKHGGAGTDKEGEHGVGEFMVGVPGHVNGAEHDDGEEGDEGGESDVLFLQEGDGAL